MTSVAIDLDVLDQLCENQKQIDDIVDSLFDEDPFISSAATIAGPIPFDNIAQKQADNHHSQLNLLFPIALEIAAIYYGIMYLL